MFKNIYNSCSDIVIIEKKYIPFLFIILFVMMNGFYNSLAVELGFDSRYGTFLFNPKDFMADLIKSALAFPGGGIPQFDRWNELYKSYYINNPYSQVIDVTNNKITNLHGTPFLMLFFIIMRNLLSLINIRLIIILAQCMWIFPLVAVIILYLKNNFLRLIVFMTCILSYPALFLMTRGHVPSGIVGICIIIACLLVYESKLPFLMILCLIIAINIRPNLLLVCGLPFLAWDFYKALGYGILIFIGSICVYLILFCIANLIYPPYTIASFLTALNIYHSIYVIGDGGMAYGSSLLGAVKLIQKIFGFDVNIVLAEEIIISSSIIMGFYWILLVYTRSMRKFDALFAILCVSALGTSAFGDYHLFSFLALIIIYAKNISNKIQFDEYKSIVVFAVCLLLIPKNYYFYNDISYQVILNPIIMVLSIMFIFYYASKNLYKNYMLGILKFI